MSSATFPGTGRDPGQQFIQEIETLLRSSNVPRATELARNALAQGFMHPVLLELRANWFESQGQDREALTDLRLATSVAPGDLRAQIAHGALAAKLNLRQEAIDAFETAVRLRPDFAPSHFNLGWVQEASGALDDSSRSYERAAALDPNYAEPLTRLAGVSCVRGNWKKAHEYADRALAIDANQHVAVRAHASAAVAEGDFETAERLLLALRENVRIPSVDRAVNTGILADLRHAQGRYEEAFALYGEANREKYEFFFPARVRSGRETERGQAERLARYFTAAPANQWAAGPGMSDPSERRKLRGHVFLVGFPRSGTTLLKSLLASHPDVVASEEHDLFEDSSQAFMADDAGLNRLAAIGENQILNYRSAYWQRFAALGFDANDKIFVDKHPLNSLKLPLIAKLFPSAKILFAIRDPRDVVLSCFRRTFMLNPEFESLESSAAFYDAVMQLGEIYRRVLRLDRIDVRHEALVDDIEAESRKLCDFLGIAWTPHMLDFAERAGADRTAALHTTQIGRGLVREGMGQWRHYAAALMRVEPVLAPWIKRFGYDASIQ